MELPAYACNATSLDAVQTSRYHGQPPLRRAEAPTCGQVQRKKMLVDPRRYREKLFALAVPVFCRGGS
jgi:hypothetical protein